MSAPVSLIDSRAAWLRLAAALALSTVGGVGMWSVVVALPAVQADFGIDRAAASLPYTLNSVAVSYVYLGEFAKAETLLLEALQTEARVHTDSSYNTGSLLRSYASLLDEMQQPAKAD